MVAQTMVIGVHEVATLLTILFGGYKVMGVRQDSLTIRLLFSMMLVRRLGGRNTPLVKTDSLLVPLTVKTVVLHLVVVHIPTLQERILTPQAHTRTVQQAVRRTVRVQEDSFQRLAAGNLRRRRRLILTVIRLTHTVLVALLLLADCLAVRLGERPTNLHITR